MGFSGYEERLQTWVRCACNDFSKNCGGAERSCLECSDSSRMPCTIFVPRFILFLDNLSLSIFTVPLSCVSWRELTIPLFLIGPNALIPEHVMQRLTLMHEVFCFSIMCHDIFLLMPACLGSFYSPPCPLERRISCACSQKCGSCTMHHSHLLYHATSFRFSSMPRYSPFLSTNAFQIEAFNNLKALRFFASR